jgi:hypothetical protein
MHKVSKIRNKIKTKPIFNRQFGRDLVILKFEISLPPFQIKPFPINLPKEDEAQMKETTYAMHYYPIVYRWGYFWFYFRRSAYKLKIERTRMFISGKVFGGN